MGRGRAGFDGAVLETGFSAAVSCRAKPSVRYGIIENLRLYTFALKQEQPGEIYL